MPIILEDLQQLLILLFLKTLQPSSLFLVVLFESSLGLSHQLDIFSIPLIANLPRLCVLFSQNFLFPVMLVYQTLDLRPRVVLKLLL